MKILVFLLSFIFLGSSFLLSAPKSDRKEGRHPKKKAQKIEDKKNLNLNMKLKSERGLAIKEKKERKRLARENFKQDKTLLIESHKEEIQAIRENMRSEFEAAKSKEEKKKIKRQFLITLGVHTFLLLLKFGKIINFLEQVINHLGMSAINMTI